MNVTYSDAAISVIQISNDWTLAMSDRVESVDDRLEISSGSEVEDGGEVLKQTAQLSLKETVLLITQSLKGGNGSERMKSGNKVEDDSGRKGARETIQQVDK